MDSKTITTLADFVQAIVDLGPGIYRGQEDNFPLLPGIFRSDMDAARERYPELESRLLQRFRLNAAPYVHALNDTSNVGWWRCLAIAQHYRLRTRLLDWTASPLAALYFATKAESSSSSGRVVYHLKYPKAVTAEEFALQVKCEPWNYDRQEISFLQPELTDPRVYAQGSLFSVHPKKPGYSQEVDFCEQKVSKIVIPGDKAREIWTHLHRFGVTDARLFPGPDGVSETLVSAARGEIMEDVPL
jgi:hypothetical protein